MPRVGVFMVLSFLFMASALLTGIFRLMSLNSIYSGILVEFYPLHSFLMVFGFLAVIIMTERGASIGTTQAARMERSHRVMVPLIVLGVISETVAYFTGNSVVRYGGALLIVSGCLAFLLTLRSLRQNSNWKLPFNFMMLSVIALLIVAAVSGDRLIVGNLGLTMLLVLFPVLFILGERIELSRFSPSNANVTRSRIAFLLASGCIILYAVAGAPLPSQVTLTSFQFASLLLLIAFFAIMEGEARTVRLLLKSHRSLQRYVATHVGVAYAWGALSVILTLAFALSSYSTNVYDASIHAFTVGFVGTMMLGHGPVIIPGLTGKKFPEKKLTFLPLTALSTAMILRILGELLQLTVTSTVLNVIVSLSGWAVLAALLLFVLMIAIGIRSKKFD